MLLPSKTMSPFSMRGLGCAFCVFSLGTLAPPPLRDGPLRAPPFTSESGSLSRTTSSVLTLLAPSRRESLLTRSLACVVMADMSPPFPFSSPSPPSPLPPLPLVVVVVPDSRPRSSRFRTELEGVMHPARRADTNPLTDFPFQDLANFPSHRTQIFTSASRSCSSTALVISAKSCSSIASSSPGSSSPPASRFGGGWEARFISLMKASPSAPRMDGEFRPTV
mmetsp:Transcript_8332/g.13513  ORF Transcript_8332/g.13513 Transcript_8332/m.13513 type:complete len:222 (-) Transcript_8332:244-909(-)